MYQCALCWCSWQKANQEFLSLCVLQTRLTKRFPTMHQVTWQPLTVALVPASRPSICGSFSESSSTTQRTTSPASNGSTAARASSRSKTLPRWPSSGVAGKTGLPWTMTSWAVLSASTTRRVSSRRPRCPSALSISSARLTYRPDFLYRGRFDILEGNLTLVIPRSLVLCCWCWWSKRWAELS